MGPRDGGAIRDALKWLAARRQEEPATPRMKLIDEAGLRFDLTPLEVDFLVEAWRDPQPGTSRAA
jgi:hypothetical protein